MGVDPSRVRFSGPLVSHVDGFLVQLKQQGYAASTVVFHLRLMAHLSRWLQAQDLVASGLSPTMVDTFLVERRAAGYVDGRATGSLEPLLGYLRAAGALPPEEPPPPASVVDVMLARYSAYLARERGLAKTTITRNLGLVRPFLTTRMRGGELNLDELAATEVTTFVLDESRRRPVSLARMVTALRSLLRFLHADGVTGAALADTVPAVARWKLAGLPTALANEQVAALLASRDLSTVVGRRDVAVLTVLSRLGLRAGELARLRLDDIDWRRGEITVVGSKGGRCERLPLPADVGSAIVSYLTNGRPHTDVRTVFLSARALHRAMTRGAVTTVVARAARRAGLGTVHAHRLRHSAATAMLGAGASLGEIGQVLRHRDALTTTIYAKVDIEALRTIARVWLGSESSA